MNKWIIRVVCFYFWKCYFLNTQCNFFYINMSSLVINSFKNEINTIILKILRCVGSTSFSHSPLDALLWWYTVLCVSNLSRGGPNLWRASHINITGAYGRTSAVPYSIIYPIAQVQLLGPSPSHCQPKSYWLPQLQRSQDPSRWGV